MWMYAAIAFFCIFGCTTMIIKERYIREQWSVFAAKDKEAVKVIENFNNAKGINQIGGINTYISLAETESETKYVQGDAVENRGKYLKVASAKDAIEISFKTQLQRLDVSKAEALSFFIKNYFAFKKQEITLTMCDAFGSCVSVVIDKEHLVPHRSKNEWNEVIVLRDELFGIDLNSLRSLDIIIKLRKDSKEIDTFALDNFAFVGRERLYFESLKDNLYGFPKQVLDPYRRKELLSLRDKELAREIAYDTWKFFENAVDRKTFLPLDTIKVDDPQWIGDYTSPTNIGLYLMSCVGAREMGFISEQSAEERIANCLQVVAQLPTWKGFLYNYYNTTTLLPTSTFVSSVDLGWYAAGLIVVRQSCNQANAQRASHLLHAMNFRQLYDPAKGQLHIGYDVKEQKLQPYHYGLIATEARLVSFIGIGKGDLPQTHWFSLDRTLPESWDWQQQKPQGAVNEYLGKDVFQGYYEYKGTKFVPSWGGSLFEFLMPSLVMNEKELAPRGLGLNNVRTTRLHINYALQERGYPVWGLSPASSAEKRYGDYGEFGIPHLGAKGYNDFGVVTPHVSFLALDVEPQKALSNIRAFLKLYPMYGEYGLYDSIVLSNNKISYKYLALDQGMTFIGLVNYLREDIIKKKFHEDAVVKSAENLLKIERFFEKQKKKK